MTAKQTDDRTKTDSLQQMTATYKKQKDNIILLYTRKKKDLSTQAGRKHTKTNESITIFTCFPNSHKYTFKKYRRCASDF